MPPVLLLASPQMVKNYEEFGDSMMFDITYNTCNIFTFIKSDKSDKVSKRYWNLGVFSVVI